MVELCLIRIRQKLMNIYAEFTILKNSAPFNFVPLITNQYRQSLIKLIKTGMIHFRTSPVTSLLGIMYITCSSLKFHSENNRLRLEL